MREKGEEKQVGSTCNFEKKGKELEASGATDVAPAENSECHLAAPLSSKNMVDPSSVPAVVGGQGFPRANYQEPSGQCPYTLCGKECFHVMAAGTGREMSHPCEGHCTEGHHAVVTSLQT